MYTGLLLQLIYLSMFMSFIKKRSSTVCIVYCHLCNEGGNWDKYLYLHKGTLGE